MHEHDNNFAEEEKNREIVQNPPSAEAEQASHAKVHDDGGSKDEEEVAAATDDTDEGQRIAQDLKAKLAVQPAEAEAQETNKEGRLGRGAKKAAAKGAIVPINDETDDVPEGVNKKAEKAAVVPVDDETDDEIVAPTGGDQAPVAAPAASEEADGEEATKCDNEHS